MTSKERVRETLLHREPDRVPIFELTVANPILEAVLGRRIDGIVTGESKVAALRANSKGTEARRSLIKENVLGMIEAYKKIGFDMIWVRPTEYLTPVEMCMNDFITPNMIFEVTIEELGKNTFKIVDEEHDFWSIEQYSAQSNTCPTVHDCIKERGLGEFRRYIGCIEELDTSMNEYLKDGLQGLTMAVKQGREQDLFICGNADISFPTFYPWVALFLELMISDPQLVHRYLDVTTTGMLELVKAQLEIGVDGILGANDWCYNAGPLMSPAHFRTFLAPYLKKIVDKCHSYGVPFIKHLDGNVQPILDILVNEVGIDGIHSLEPAAGVDIAWVKKTYGDKVTLFGNIDCGDLLSSGPQEAVVEEVKNILRMVSPGGGHVFNSSNCIHSGVSLDNFWTMVKAVKKYGTYPLSV